MRARGSPRPWLAASWWPIAGGLGVVLAIALIQTSPWMPQTLDWGDLRYAQQAPRAAVAHWDAVGRWHPSRQGRVRAHLRAADVAELWLDDLSGASRYLRRVLSEEPPPEVQAEVWIRLAHLADREGGGVEDSLAAWRTAGRVDPDGPHRAAARRGEARALARAGRLQEALLAWDEVIARDPEAAAEAWLAQGSLLLAADDVWGALEAYEQAAAADGSDAQQAARLGAATAQARLGDVEGALRSLSDAGLPEAVARSRAQALRRRAAEGQDRP